MQKSSEMDGRRCGTSMDLRDTVEMLDRILMRGIEAGR